MELPVVWNNNERASKVKIVPDSIWTAIEVFQIALHVARLLCLPRLVQDDVQHTKAARSDEHRELDGFVLCHSVTHGQRCGNGSDPRRELPALRLVAMELSKLAAVLLFAVWLGIALSSMHETNPREHISYPESVYTTPLPLSE